MGTETGDRAASNPGPQAVEALREILAPYDAVLSDVWGVVHDGVAIFRPAEAALIEARREGKTVVLITNSPRPRDGVVAQLRQLGLDDAAWDEIVTSGDATRALITRLGGPIHHVGPARDVDLFAGLQTALASLNDASSLVVTGLLDDEAESPEDYLPLLEAARARDLPLICANPDIVVHRGPKLVWCAGALAREYAKMDGEVHLAGKPHAPIYDLALSLAGNPDRSRVLAVGDGGPTDVLGASQNGLDVLFVVNGIHGVDLADADPVAIAELLGRHGGHAEFHIPVLK